ncbi:unnamed protein product [Notodromas monacha]|uniref:ELMO domain-containing protein n=1 Tax=Notodromas monacha TaxID=399045 RepID=A0A7R9BNU7_9CRUS|nr:unnamed protein product [Notodromas monacha]CAG0917424.1 unnamed protein product [Notodromas monacha]
MIRAFDIDTRCPAAVTCPNQVFLEALTDLDYVEILVNYGDIQFLGAGIGENYEEGFDFGTMGVGEKRDMRFALRNDNPIEIRIRGWGSNMSRSYVELLGSQRVSALNLFQLQDLPLLPKTLVIKPHHFILFRVGILSAPEQEGMYNAHVFIVTSYQDLFVPFRLRTAKGTMSVPGGGNLIQLGNSFPGKITEKTVRIHSTFRHDLVVDDFTSLPSDARFTFHPTDSGSAKLTPVLQAGEISLIGRLTYDPVIGCSPSCYSSLHLQSKLGQDWLSSLVHPPSLTDLDVFLFSSMRERFERDTSVSRQLNFTFQLDTNEVKGFLFRAQTRLAWPEVVAKKEHTFPMTQIGNSTFTDVTLTNPSSYPLVVQAFLLPTKDSSYTSLKKMLHHLRNWFSAVDDFGTSAASVLMHDDHDEEGVSNSEDSDPTSRHAGESFSFIDLDSDTTLHDSAHGPSASQPVQRIHNLPNLNGTLSVVLAPGANLSLRISFTPDCEMRHESLLVVRNNLTVLDLMFLKGTGGQGHLRFGNRRAGSPMPLLFDIAVKHLKDCDKDKAHASGPPNLTVKRSFTARNTGSLPIHVYGFTIDGFECEGYGFRVMNCRPGFVLPPNGTHKVDIAFTPDFTLTRVQRSLFMSTSLPAGVLNFSLVATLPPQSLAPCWAALPRPAWEAMLGYVAIVAMTVVLLCVLPAAFFEADRILVMAFDFGDDLAFLMPVDAAKAGKASAPSEDAQKKMVAKPLNLKEVGRQAVEELAENSVRRRTNVLNRPSTQKVKDGEMIGEKRESQSLLRLALRFVMYFWNDSSPAWESVKEVDKTPETPPATASHQKDAAGSRSNGNVLKQQSQPSSNNKRKTGEKTPAVVPVCTEVTRHSVAVETDRTLEIPVKSQGKKSKRKGRNGAEQRKKDCTKLDEDSSSTTTDNNSLLDDDCDRDLGLKNDAMTKGKKDKRIHHVASEPVISAVPVTRSEGKPKQKVEPYKFEVPSNYEAEPVFQPAKKSDPKAKENEAPYFMFNQQANSKTKKSNPVKAAVEKSKSFNGTTNKPLSMQSEESPSPVSAWVLPMESDVGAIKKSKSGSSSSTSSDGFAEMARQTEKFTQEHMPYRLKEKNTNVFSSNSRGLSQGFGMPDSGLRQKAKVIPFQKNMQTQKLCGNPVEPMRQSNPFQQSRARPDLAACSRQRQAFDQELGSFTVLTRPSETTPEQLQALDMLFGARRSKLRADANDDDDVFRGFGTGLVGDDKTIKTSQQYADAMFAAPPPPPPQPPAAAASSSRMMDIFRMESSCRDTPWPVSRGFFPNDSATTSAFPFGPSRVWDNADPRGEVRDSLWDPPYCRGGSVSPFQSSSVWGNSGLGLGGSSCWSPNVLSGCSSSSFGKLSVLISLIVMHMSVFTVWNAACLWIRATYKWFLRKFTRLCELQRICYGVPAGAPRILGVENSLARSRTSILLQLVSFLDGLAAENKFGGEQLPQVVESTCLAVASVKRINLRSHVKFRKTFSRCVESIWSFRQLAHEVEWLRKTRFDCDNPVHEHKLRLLWNELVPEEPLESRVTKQWGYIGFQGDDPATDFRGMGMLGLENLLYFAKFKDGTGRRVLCRSQHPKYGYSFAIVGINLTDMALGFVRSGDARTHFYNTVRHHNRPFFTIRDFHVFYSILFESFDRLWHMENPKDIMEFGRIAEKFAKLVKQQLTLTDALLTPDFLSVKT